MRPASVLPDDNNKVTADRNVVPLSVSHPSNLPSSSSKAAVKGRATDTIAAAPAPTVAAFLAAGFPAAVLDETNATQQMEETEPDSSRPRLKHHANAGEQHQHETDVQAITGRRSEFTAPAPNKTPLVSSSANYTSHDRGDPGLCTAAQKGPSAMRRRTPTTTTMTFWKSRDPRLCTADKKDSTAHGAMRRRSPATTTTTTLIYFKCRDPRLCTAAQKGPTDGAMPRRSPTTTMIFCKSRDPRLCTADRKDPTADGAMRRRSPTTTMTTTGSPPGRETKTLTMWKVGPGHACRKCHSEGAPSCHQHSNNNILRGRNNNVQ